MTKLPKTEAEIASTARGPGFDGKTTAIFLTTTVHVGPLIITFTNNVVFNKP